MKITETHLAGVKLIEPQVFGDHRGFFMETYQADRYKAEGIMADFVQDNFSRSTQGILRGLHIQLEQTQAKLVSVVRGEVFDVAVDIRRGSPTFGQWYGAILSEENRHQLYIPEGFAHGFCVLSESADFTYKCNNFYHPQSELTVLWNDPDLGIDWPISNPKLSAKDEAGQRLKDINPELLPVYENH